MVDGLKERFASIRERHGLSVKEFAESLDMEPTTLSSIESGKREPSKEVLLKLALRYAYSLNWIFTGIGEERLPKAILPEQNKHPILENLEKLIDEKTSSYGRAISNIETRLSTLEKSLKVDLSPSVETDDDVYTVESDLEYGEAIYSNLFVAESEPTPEYMTRSIAFCDDIAAGPPIWQSEDKGRVVDVPYHLIKTNESDYYALRVKGNSMIDAFIPDGSMVLIKKSDVPQHGKIHVIWLDDRVTLKRMREDEDHGWTLCYEDGTGRTIPLGENNQIQGTFEAVLPPATRPRMRGEN